MSLAKLTIPVVPVAYNQPFRVVTPPTLPDQQERIAALAGLISAMSSPFPDQKDSVEFVYNLICIGIPEIAAAASPWTSVKSVAITPTREEYLTWAGVLEGADMRINPLLPRLPGTPIPDAFGITDEKAVYLALASLLFCIGKQASESARASVLDNRPDALIRRFGISEENQILLPGKIAGPAREALEQVYNSFANYTEIRTDIIKVFLGWRKAGTHLPIHLEILMTNFNLLRGVGMTHVEAIIRLTGMHPWTLRVPALSPYFHRFLQELTAWEKIDPQVRLYHRLLVPQSEYMFLSSEYRPLIAVAGAFIEDVEKTFGGYVYNKAAYTQLIDEVRSYVPGYHPTQGLAQLAGLLGVADEPLPIRTSIPKLELTQTL